jgi:hypothetical protein
MLTFYSIKYLKIINANVLIKLKKCNLHTNEQLQIVCSYCYNLYDS